LEKGKSKVLEVINWVKCIYVIADVIIKFVLLLVHNFRAAILIYKEDLTAKYTNGGCFNKFKQYFRVYYVNTNNDKIIFTFGKI
jgi:hypothetical protein